MVSPEEVNALVQKGEIFRVPPHQQTGQASEGQADLLLPARFVPNPGSTSYLAFDDKTSGIGFLPGDTVVLDKSYKNAQDLRPLWGQEVVVEYTDEALAKLPVKSFIYLGRLRWQGIEAPFIFWVAMLSTFNCPRDFPDRSGHHDLVIGRWDTQIEAREASSEVIEKSRAEAPAKIRLDEGYRILGRVICWFRPPREGEK